MLCYAVPTCAVPSCAVLCCALQVRFDEAGSDYDGTTLIISEIPPEEPDRYVHSNSSSGSGSKGMLVGHERSSSGRNAHLMGWPQEVDSCYPLQGCSLPACEEGWLYTLLWLCYDMLCRAVLTVLCCAILQAEDV